MTRVRFRPSRVADLAPLGISAPPYRFKGLTALLDGRPIGIGGIVFKPDGSAWASVHMLDEAHAFKAALLRAAKRVLAEADAAGYRVIYASPEVGVAGAERLLAHLGFQPEAGGRWARRR